MRILYKYAFKQFLGTYLFALIALCIIFIVVDLLEHLDAFIDNNAGLKIVISYYLNFLPEIIKIISPISMLLSTLFTVGRLSVNNEIIAMKSGGLSLHSFMLPFLVLSIIISLLNLYFNGWIVPESNKIKYSIEQRYLNIFKSGGPINNLYFRESPKRNLIIQFYDTEAKEAINVSIDEFTSENNPRLLKKYEARRMIWDSINEKWKLINVFERNFGYNLNIIRYDTFLLDLKIREKDILRFRLSVDEMNFTELREYLDLLEQGGKDVRKQEIEYYGSFAFPFANIIVVLFGVPFASVKRRGGIAVQIGVVMVISFFYLVFTKISQTIGLTTGLSPELVGWSANLIFLVLGIIVLFRTKT